jgi:uncharacterized membrane protein YqiK
VVDRDRAVSLAQMSNERELETERRTVAEVVRERVAVDRTVAEQEEKIKGLRAVEAAERERQAIIIRAEADAQEHLVKDIKAAEAAEAASKFRAKESMTLAEAEVAASELHAKAKIRLAEATQAEAAAEGLAQVQVRERDADAIEKIGRAEAAVLRERNTVEADGVRDKLKGEAEGLHEKAAAMAVLDDATREHEEFRLRLELQKEVELATVQAHRDVAQAQADVLSVGLQNAKIDIVGGESMFLDKLVGSIGLGKGLDRLLHSDTGTAATAVVGSLLARNGSGTDTSDAAAALDLLLDK